MKPPDSHIDLLQKPLYAHVATVRPDGGPQSSPMWFGWDGEHIRMTHTSKRQKFRNFERDPRIALSIVDPEGPLRGMEIRGTVSITHDDDEASFYQGLQRRYGRIYPIEDVDVRIILTVEATRIILIEGGSIVGVVS
jgi:PPOX class probable F420-dependent enzyme